MPQRKHARTGVLITCSDETAARLSGEWQPVGQARAESVEKPAPRKRSAKNTGK